MNRLKSDDVVLLGLPSQQHYLCFFGAPPTHYHFVMTARVAHRGSAAAQSQRDKEHR